MKLTEKQKLRKRLTTFCGMLGDDLHKLDPELQTRIETTISRLGATTKIAIAGLADSQHRGLAEFLLGETLFRNDEEREKCPLIQVRYGKEAKTHAIFGETRKTYPGLSLSLTLGGKAPDAIGLEVPNPITADIAFTILPPYDGDDNRAGYLVNLLDDTETIIWCSNAKAPWQPKERRLWFTVPDTLKERSILALTGAENVIDDAARMTLNEKRAFVEDDFRHLLPIFIEAAKSAFVGGKPTDAAQFKSSGGEALYTKLMSLVQDGQSEVIAEAKNLRLELDKIPLGSSQPAPSAPLSTASTSTQSSSPTEAMKALILTGANRCRAAVAECTNQDFAPVFEPMTELLANIQTALHDEVTLDRDNSLLLAQISEATELTGLLRYENNGKAAQEAADITLQIVSDIWARLPTAESMSTAPETRSAAS